MKTSRGFGTLWGRGLRCLYLFPYSALSLYFFCRVKQKMFTAGILSPSVIYDGMLLPLNLYVKREYVGIFTRDF